MRGFLLRHQQVATIAGSAAVLVGVMVALVAVILVGRHQTPTTPVAVHTPTPSVKIGGPHTFDVPGDLFGKTPSPGASPSATPGATGSPAAAGGHGPAPTAGVQFGNGGCAPFCTQPPQGAPAATPVPQPAVQFGPDVSAPGAVYVSSSPDGKRIWFTTAPQSGDPQVCSISNGPAQCADASGTRPGAIAGDDTQAWFIDRTGQAIGHVTVGANKPDNNGYTIVKVAGDPFAGDHDGMVLDSAGTIWFTESGNGHVASFRPGQQGGNVPAGQQIDVTNGGQYRPTSITQGRDGRIYFGEVSPGLPGLVGVVTGPGSAQEFTVNQQVDVTAVSQGPGDALIWFATNAGVGQLRPGNVAVITVGNGLTGNHYGMAQGPGGALWVTSDDGSLSRIADGGSTAAAHYAHGGSGGPATIGGDRRLYYTDGDAISNAGVS